MPRLQDHKQRYALANELHARPFLEIPDTCTALYLALSNPDGPDAARQRLGDLLDRFGARRPAENGNHHHCDLGRNLLKWELFSEFEAYTLFIPDDGTAAFSDGLMRHFPGDWLAALPGQVMTAVQLRVERSKDADIVEKRLGGDALGWFVGESLAAAFVLDRNAAIAGDFRIDAAGQVRFAVFGIGAVGPRRLGRVVQRVLEIEAYKSMAMLTLPVARKVFARVGQLDAELTAIAGEMTQTDLPADKTLDRLLRISAEIGALASESAFRFSAGRAYRAIVDQRIAVLREDRLAERQLFSEFMMRRFDPAMRTCEAAEKRLDELSARAARAAELLATRVGVAAAEQNRALLESMNRRAAMQMRLQETVEGLSVVAVGYYAVNLLSYLAAPLAKPYIGKGWLMALLVPPVLGVVWLMLARIKRRVAAAFGETGAK
ncbi:MAG: DUF3422 domain-containing protein [Rhodobacteraceae bacterium]|nr:DUF3422 domain-containing protein [Paracoccaceae bacterium]